jgi:uncharacterized protein YjiS (DUF1127 family)
MPALTSLTISGAAPFGRALVAIGRGVKQFVKRLRNRRTAHRLASLDNRMLADLGLTRGDLHDAFAELPWRDPSDMLARRAAERRSHRRLTEVGRVDSPTTSQALEALCYPPLDRPVRTLM